jgi:hypothetical protein
MSDDKMYTAEGTEAVIARVGWGLMGVCSGSRDAPDWVHTIGLAAKGQPELIAFALPRDVAYYALNILAQRMTDGETLPLNERMKDVLRADVVLIEADYPLASPRMTGAVSRAPGCRVVQLVWPDPKTDAFPWEAGYGARYAAMQPILRAVRH